MIINVLQKINVFLFVRDSGAPHLSFYFYDFQFWTKIFPPKSKFGLEWKNIDCNGKNIDCNDCCKTQNETSPNEIPIVSRFETTKSNLNIVKVCQRTLRGFQPKLGWSNWPIDFNWNEFPHFSNDWLDKSLSNRPIYKNHWHFLTSLKQVFGQGFFFLMGNNFLVNILLAFASCKN